MKSLPIVEVHWVDSAFCRGWQTLENKRHDQGIVTCRSIGYLLSSDKKEVRLVGSQGFDHMTKGEPDVADGLSIPRVAVKRIRRIK